MLIIPAIDIIDGKCVRLSQGDYNKTKVYNDNPVEVARMFEEVGLKYLHLVDLDGARQGKVINWKTLEAICRQTNLHIDFGGGIKTKAEIRQILETGAKQVNLGSIAVKEPEKVHVWANEFGPDRIILSADVREKKIAIHGWSETSSISIEDFIEQYLSIDINHVTCTDIQTDGMLSGPNFKLYEYLIQRFPGIKLIASGGVSSMDDLIKLKKLKVHGVIVGKAIYEGRIKMEELKAVNLD